MDKPLFIISATNGEGLQDAWAFRAENEWEVADFILQNLEVYKDLLDKLSIKTSRKKLRAEALFQAMKLSQIDFNTPFIIDIYQVPEDRIAIA